MTAETASPQPSPTGGAPWACEVRSKDPLVITISGELDTMTRPFVQERLMEAIDGSTGPVRIEVGDIAFIDSQGLSALIDVCNAHADRDFTLVGPRPNVRRLIQITGLDQLFTVLDG